MRATDKTAVAVATTLGLYALLFGRLVAAYAWWPEELMRLGGIFVRSGSGYNGWEISWPKVAFVVLAQLLYSAAVTRSAGISSRPLRAGVYVGALMVSSVFVTALSWIEVGVVLRGASVAGTVERWWIDFILLPRETPLGFLMQLVIAALGQAALVLLIIRSLGGRSMLLNPEGLPKAAAAGRE